MKAKETLVTVDRDFVRSGSKSYAVNKINTVEVRQRRPYGAYNWIVWAVIASVFLYYTYDTAHKIDLGLAWPLFLAALVYWFAFRSWKRAKIVEYDLYLVTSSGAVQATKSRDSQAIFALRERIEKAISGS